MVQSFEFLNSLLGIFSKFISYDYFLEDLKGSSVFGGNLPQSHPGPRGEAGAG